jgi:uncharacterized protein (DUF1501 family)
VACQPSLTVGSFDTHKTNSQHAGLLKQLADGLVALQLALTELGAWIALVMTFLSLGAGAAEQWH